MNTDLEELTPVPEPSKAFLNQRQVIDYEEHRKQLLTWLLTFGKEPEKVEGYALETVKPRSYRIDQFYRWVWAQERQYTTRVTTNHADEWVTELAFSEKSNVHKNNCLKAVMMLFKWRHHRFGEDHWEPKHRFKSERQHPRDFLTREERVRIREAVLEYGSIPHYKSVTPEERREWKRYLAQRFGKPVESVTPQDWNRANGWKFPSLVWTSLDAGLRPIEVERAVVSWVDTENKVLRIPKEESSKNRDNWVVSLRDQTAEYLRRWLEERRLYEKYSETDALWLTRKSNPYQSNSLKYLLVRLCEQAEIETENRKMSWYVIRHSVGTYMACEGSLGAAKAQLRHRCSGTTMKYDQAPVEERREALERMG